MNNRETQRLQEVTKEQATCLYMLGFDWPCNHMIGDIPVPTVELALKWARDTQGIVCAPSFYEDHGYINMAYNPHTKERFYLRDLYVDYDIAASDLVDIVTDMIEKQRGLDKEGRKA